MKGRDVILGDNVKDEGFDWAQFDDLGSATPSMEGARAVLVVSLLPGYIASQSDAVSAYTPAFLKGTETWVHLPRERWPAKWIEDGLVNPVVPLKLALYGHPDAGTH